MIKYKRANMHCSGVRAPEVAMPWACATGAFHAIGMICPRKATTSCWYTAGVTRHSKSGLTDRLF